jgi:hypothetical protein
LKLASASAPPSNVNSEVERHDTVLSWLSLSKSVSWGDFFHSKLQLDVDATTFRLFATIRETEWPNESAARLLVLRHTLVADH